MYNYIVIYYTNKQQNLRTLIYSKTIKRIASRYAIACNVYLLFLQKYISLPKI